MSSIGPMESNHCVISAKMMRSTVAAPMPTRIALRRWSAGKPAAAMPMTMALSPARTRSIAMTWRSAEKPAAGEIFPYG